MKSSVTEEQVGELKKYLKTHKLCMSLHDHDDNVCSMAAINIALTGRIADEIPECMSRVLGRWIIVTQDLYGDDMRNSQLWKELLPIAVTKGRELEAAQLVKLISLTFNEARVVARRPERMEGIEDEWADMIRLKTESAVNDVLLKIPVQERGFPNRMGVVSILYKLGLALLEYSRYLEDELDDPIYITNLLATAACMCHDRKDLNGLMPALILEQLVEVE